MLLIFSARIPVLFFLAVFGFCSYLYAENYGKITIGEISSMLVGSGHTEHGYVEYRFRIANRDTKPHRVTLSLPMSNYHNGGAALTRSANSVEVPAESSATLRLLHPPVAMHGNDEIQVVIDGRSQRDPLRTQTVSNSHLSGYKTELEAFVLVSNSGVLATVQNDILLGVQKKPEKTENENNENSTDPPSFHTSSRITTPPKVFTEGAIMPVSEWSDNWLGYTRFDGIAVSSAEWKELQEQHPAVFKAIRQYTEAGGILLMIGTDWIPPKEWIRDKDNSSVYLAVLGRVFVMEKEAEKAQKQIEPFRTLVLRHSQNWQSALGDRYRGSSGVLGSDTPLLDSMPVVADYGVSLRLILILIVIFAVLIGPVNVYILSKMKRRLWLLWTVPAISLTACVLVFSVSFFKEGFLRQAGSATCTVLDQRRETAVSFGFVGYYATLAPSGIVFSPDTEATVCVNRQPYGSSRSLEVDVLPNGSQFFTGRWVVARVPSYFLLRKAESMRKERLLFDWTAEKPTVTNGLGASVDELTVCAADGTFYSAKNVKAGEKVILEDTGRKEIHPRNTTLRQLQEDYVDALLVGRLPSSSNISPYTYISPNTYIATFSAWNPFIEPGIDRMKPYQNQTVIYGFFDEKD